MPVYTNWAVGDKVTADRLNANLVEQEIQLTTRTSDSSTWGDTEAVTGIEVTGTLVSGLIYEIWFWGRVSSDVAADYTALRIREDSISGTQLQFSGNIELPTTTGNGFPQSVVARYTAVSSASKTFVLTGDRQSGTGTAHRIRASASAAAFFGIRLVLN